MPRGAPLFLQIIAVFFSISVAVWIIYRYTNIPTDFNLWMNLVIQLAILLIGVYVTLNQEIVSRFRNLLLWIFVLLALAGLYFSTEQVRQSAKQAEHAERKAQDANAKLALGVGAAQSASIEAARLAALNSALQEKLLSQSQQVARLSRDILGDVAGEGTYCYFLATPHADLNSRSTFTLSLSVIGRFPMRNMGIVMNTATDPRSSFESSLRPVPLPDTTIPPGVYEISSSFEIPLGRHIFQIWGRSGLMTQELILQLSEDGQLVQTGDVWGGGRRLHVINPKRSR